VPPHERSDEEVKPRHRTSSSPPDRPEHHNAEDGGEEQPDHGNGGELATTTGCHHDQHPNTEPDGDLVASTLTCVHD
jgi:hypothetical protein